MKIQDILAPGYLPMVSTSAGVGNDIIPDVKAIFLYVSPLGLTKGKTVWELLEPVAADVFENIDPKHIIFLNVVLPEIPKQTRRAVKEIRKKIKGMSSVTEGEFISYDVRDFLDDHARPLKMMEDILGEHNQFLENIKLLDKAGLLTISAPVKLAK